MKLNHTQRISRRIPTQSARHTTGTRYAPEVRARALEHNARGLLHKEIQRMLFREFGVVPTLGGIRYWLAESESKEN